MDKLRFAIFSELKEFADEIRNRLSAVPGAEVAVIVDDPEDLSDALKAESPDVLYADLGHAPHVVLDLLESLGSAMPDLLVSGCQDDSQVILRSMQIGAREFLPQAPNEDDLNRAIQRLLRGRQVEPAIERSAQVISVMGAKGGVGATCVTSQLAASLQEKGGRVVIVDLNFPLGDVALHFDIEPSYTLADIAREGDSLDGTYLRSILQVHQSGVQILAAPPRIEDSELIQGEHVTRLLEILRRQFDFVLLDVSRNWNDASVRALDLADQILVVTSLDVPTLHHARKHMELLRRLGHPTEKIHAVVNRQSSGDAVTERDLTRFLGRKADAAIPNDYANTVESVNQGKPLGEIAPRAALTQAFRDLAHQVHVWCGLAENETTRSTKLTDRFRRIFEK